MKEIQRLARLNDDIDYMLNLLEQRGIMAPRTLNIYCLSNDYIEDNLLEDVHTLSQLVDKHIFIN